MQESDKTAINIEKKQKRSKSSKRTVIDDQWPLKASCYKLETAVGLGSYGLCWKAHVFD